MMLSRVINRACGIVVTTVDARLDGNPASNFVLEHSLYHAGGGEIDVAVTDESVDMTLTDQGPGIPDIALAMSEGWSTAPDEVRSLGFGAGMGLPNMKKYSDEFDIQSTVGVGTTVKMLVNID